jgi:hypothetical protein
MSTPGVQETDLSMLIPRLPSSHSKKAPHPCEAFRFATLAQLATR